MEGEAKPVLACEGSVPRGNGALRPAGRLGECLWGRFSGPGVGDEPVRRVELRSRGPDGENILNSEVEPFVDVSPANGDNIIGVWQQDRWSSGASRGNVVGASLDDGRTWKVIKQTKNSLCTGGTLANGGGYERASDPG